MSVAVRPCIMTAEQQCSRGYSNDHLVKPVDFETLSRCLSGLPAGAFTRRVS
jgi:hypothetical protein